MRQLVLSEDVYVPMSTWDNIKTWQYVLPPSRPSNEHLSIIRESIEQVDRAAPVAILGSTPEFRDLLHEEGFQQIHVLDKNRRVYRMMSKLRAYSNVEEFVYADWFDSLPRFASTFALMLSDLTIGNISYSSRPHFYELVANSLCPQGLFIDKILTHPCEHLRLKALEEKYLLLPLNLLHVNEFSCEFFFCSELLYESDLVNTSMFYDILQSRFQHERLQAFLDQCPLITPRDCIWYYGKRWDDIKDGYCSGLHLVKSLDDDPGSPYYKRLKLMIWIRS